MRKAQQPALPADDLFGAPDPDKLELAAGVDEAGRGPLAGPVYAAAVILDPARPIEGLRDSKKLTPEKREELAAIIKERALAWSIACSSAEEIDRTDILRATMRAMAEALEGLSVQPRCVLVDGNRTPPYRKAPVVTIVKGDDKVQCISAASILAKTATTPSLTSTSASTQAMDSPGTRATAQSSTSRRSPPEACCPCTERRSSRSARSSRATARPDRG